MKFDDLLSLPHIWDVLSGEQRPILLYGTGNGADKIIDVMERRGIRPSGVFASDGFVRSREFRGMRVMSYPDAVAAFGEDIVILVAFGSPRDEVLSTIDSLSARHTLYIPDVPLFADDLEAELFTPDYVISHRGQIEHAAELFDGESAQLFWEILAYRMTAKPGYLHRTEDFASSVRACLPEDISRVIDGGAFTGDTARTFLSTLPELRRAVCAEPDSRTFRRLSEFAGTDDRLTAVNASLGDTVGIDRFSASASRASAVEKQSRRSKVTEVRRLTVDFLAGYSDSPSDYRNCRKAEEAIRPALPMSSDTAGLVSPTNSDTTGLVSPMNSDIIQHFGSAAGDGRLLIKLDVEGAERASLEGARQTIAAERPALAISLYHRTSDIFEIPLFLRSIHPDYKFSLRRVRCVPGWEITLFAY